MHCWWWFLVMQSFTDSECLGYPLVVTFPWSRDRRQALFIRQQIRKARIMTSNSMEGESVEKSLGHFCDMLGSVRVTCNTFALPFFVWDFWRRGFGMLQVNHEGREDKNKRAHVCQVMWIEYCHIMLAKIHHDPSWWQYCHIMLAKICQFVAKHGSIMIHPSLQSWDRQVVGVALRPGRSCGGPYPRSPPVVPLPLNPSSHCQAKIIYGIPESSTGSVLQMQHWDWDSTGIPERWHVENPRHSNWIFRQTHLVAIHAVWGWLPNG